MGPADFICIAANFHTVIVADIPKMGPDSQDKAVRFVTMIDTFYEKKVKFICSAASAPAGLYPEGDGPFESRGRWRRWWGCRGRDFWRWSTSPNCDCGLGPAHPRLRA